MSDNKPDPVQKLKNAPVSMGVLIAIVLLVVGIGGGWVVAQQHVQTTALTAIKQHELKPPRTAHPELPERYVRKLELELRLRSIERKLETLIAQVAEVSRRTQPRRRGK